MASSTTEPLSPTELQGRWSLFFEDSKLKKKIAQLVQQYPEVRSLEVPFAEIDGKDTSLSDNLLQYPEAVLQAAEKAVAESLPQSMATPGAIRVRIEGLPVSQRVVIRLLREAHLNRFISVEGIVRRITEVRPQMIEAVFECVACGGHTSVHQDEMSQTIKEATRCTSCEKPLGKTRFVLLPEASKYLDSQKLDVQENPETLKGGSHPEGVTVLLTEDLTGQLIPGDRVKVNGVLRSLPRIMGGKTLAKQAVFDIALFANHVEKESIEYQEIEITDEEKAEIEKMRGQEGVFEKLVDSLAPSIQGMRIEKEAIALQLFGGVPKVQADGIRIRGDIHILLIGDPGTAKSQLLRYVAEKIAPRGIYTSGKGATAAGLTAAAVKDDFGGGRWTLEAGAMVLADLGMLMVDELDKMSENDRSSMHEGLEQQSYHPSFEIMLMNGEKRQVGELVDQLISIHPERTVPGKDCQILPLEGLERYQVLTTDFKGLHGAVVDRVSRHTAPPQFIRLTYGNGRILTVTPEHPVFVWRDGEFCAAPAESIKPGDLAPGVKEYPRSLNEAVLEAPDASVTHDHLRFPTGIDGDLARLLGYMAVAGQIHYAEGSQASEVVVANTDPDSVADVRHLLRDIFGFDSCVQVQGDEEKSSPRVTTYQAPAGRALYEYFHTNFPETVQGANGKRIPGAMFHAVADDRIQFLIGAHRSGGYCDSEGFGLTTNSPGLARDYSDLLLSLGIYSSITGGNCSDGELGQKGDWHRVVISGSESQRRYYDLVARHDSAAKEIRGLLEKGESQPNDEDPIPAEFVSRVRNLLQWFGLCEARDTSGMEPGSPWHRVTLHQQLLRVKEHVRSLPALTGGGMTPRALREAYHIRIDEISSHTGRSPAWVRLHDEGKPTPQGQTIRQAVVDLSKRKLSVAGKDIADLESWLETPLRFIPVRSVETIPNPGEKWVYDVTVEPTHTFVSEGLVLHNTVSVSKAGITATLKARCPVLAAANPKLGRFSPDRERSEEINLPPTLLSRFDVIFAIQDKADAVKDRSLAGAILAKHMEAEHVEAARSKGTVPTISGGAQKSSIFRPEFMRKYIAYARKNVFPVMDDTANKTLLDFFVNMRKQAEGGKKPIPITMRQVEGLVRLSEASAKARLSPVATKGDAERAIKIVEHFLRSVATTEGSTIDIDSIQVGVSSFMRGTINTVREIMVGIDERTPSGFTVDDVLAEAEKKNIGKERVLKAIADLKRVNEVYEPRTGILKMMK